MSDHKEKGREPTEREREVAFAPHQSPRRQADGDPGRKPQPELIHDDEKEREDVGGDGSAQADGDPR